MSEIPWDAVSTVIEQARDWAAPSLTENGLVNAAVSFANGDATFLSGLTLLADADLSGMEAKHQAFQTLDQIYADHFASERRQFISDLASIIDEEAPTELVIRRMDSASQVLLVPFYEFSEGTLRVTHRCIVEDIDAQLSYVTLLFLDDSKTYGADLCRCKLEECGAFFWERRDSSGGQPGRKYCGPDHMREAQRALTTARVRRHREQKKREKLRGKPT